MKKRLSFLKILILLSVIYAALYFALWGYAIISGTY